MEAPPFDAQLALPPLTCFGPFCNLEVFREKVSSFFDVSSVFLAGKECEGEAEEEGPCVLAKCIGAMRTFGLTCQDCAAWCYAPSDVEDGQLEHAVHVTSEI